MRVLVFRPLRRIKKTGKIVVASYAQWNKLKTGEHFERRQITIDTEYQQLSDSEYVYNHKGENLFFYDYDPNEVPLIPPLLFNWDEAKVKFHSWIVGYDWGISFFMKGCDGNGTPTFSHYTENDVVKFFSKDLTKFEPLTVGMVKVWYQWWLMNIMNAEIKIKKDYRV